MHVENYTKGDAFKVIAEIERHLKHYNNNVDISKSKNNLVDTYGQKSIVDNFKRVLQDVYVYGANSKNSKTTVLTSIVVTLPRDVKKSDMLHFFGGCIEFFDTRFEVDTFGRYVGYAIHLDETTPHLHYLLAPVVNDEKHGKKVSSRQLFKRSDMSTLHQELSDFMTSKLGYKTSILLDDKECRNLPLKAYKRIQSLKTANSFHRLDMLNNSIKMTDLKRENEALKKENETLKATVDRLQNENYDLRDSLEMSFKKWTNTSQLE